MLIIRIQKEEEIIMNYDTINWPFALVNNQRTPESQQLLDQKVHSTTKPDVSDVPEALF